MGVQSHIKGGIGNGGMTSRLGMALGNDSEERFMASIMGIQKTTTIAVYDNLGTESASSAISTTSSGEDRILEVVVERFNEKSIDIITYA